MGKICPADPSTHFTRPHPGGIERNILVMKSTPVLTTPTTFRLFDTAGEQRDLKVYVATEANETLQQVTKLVDGETTDLQDKVAKVSAALG